MLISQGNLRALRKAFLTMLSPALVVGLLPLVLEQPLAEVERDLGSVFLVSALQLVRMPELGIALAYHDYFRRSTRPANQTQDSQVETRLRTFTWLILSFVGFYTFTIIFLIPLYVLPRYFIVIVPLTFFTAWEVVRRRFGPLLPGVLGLLLVTSMIATSSSALLGDPNDISSVGLESSNEYVPSLILAKEVLDGALDTGLTVYVIRNMWFRTQYPRLGYVESVPSNVQLVNGSSTTTTCRTRSSSSTRQSTCYPMKFVRALTTAHPSMLRSSS